MLYTLVLAFCVWSPAQEGSVLRQCSRVIISDKAYQDIGACASEGEALRQTYVDVDRAIRRGTGVKSRPPQRRKGAGTTAVPPSDVGRVIAYRCAHMRDA